MPVVSEETGPELFKEIEARNLEHQYYLLETMVTVALNMPELRVTREIVCELNRAAVRFLAHNPGQFRDDHSHIVGSQHEPPDWADVPKLMQEYFQYLETNWHNRSPIHLAAYAMWRLCWIHPFEEGNGRTARAVCFYVLCLKHGIWLPGSRTILGQIKGHPLPYYEALKAADRYHRDGEGIDLSVLEDYLEELLITQLIPKDPADESASS